MSGLGKSPVTCDDDPLDEDDWGHDISPELLEIAHAVDDPGSGVVNTDIDKIDAIGDPLAEPRRIAGFKDVVSVLDTEEGQYALPSPFASATAPLAQRFVGGKQVKRKRPDPVSAACQAGERDPNTPQAIKHKRQLTFRWQTKRIRQSECIIRTMIKDGQDEIGEGVITHDMSNMVLHLVYLAAYQACITPNSDKLQTASASFWSVALAQEVWQRENKGWIVHDKNAQYLLTWEHFEYILGQCKGQETRIKETSDDPLVEMLKSKIDREEGTKRIICSHSFGSHSDRRAKLDCLHWLLTQAGDPGLYPDIRNCEPPIVEEPEKPANPAQQRCIASHSFYGKTKH